MRLHKPEEIVVGKRQRKKIEPRPLHELKESIASKTLLHAPVVGYENDVPQLLVGERRFRALSELVKEGRQFHYNGELVPDGVIPTVTIHELLTATDMFELELDENRQRVNLTWQEESEALAELHRMRVASNPKQTEIDTARELLQKGNVFGVNNERRVQQRIAESVLIQKSIHNPAVAKARNAKEAASIAAKQIEEFARARITRIRLAAAAKTTSLVDIRNDDLTTAMPALEAEIFDLICADPPYGINVGSGGFRGRTVHHHNYKDDMATARSVGSIILSQGFRVAKVRANLFMFNTIDNWEWFKQVASNLGWDYFPRPLIWGKSDSEGLAPWGSKGFRITTEFIFFATKGQRGLISSPIDYLRENRVARDERVYGAEKPVPLLRKLIEISTLPGDYVLDPCCGSGTTLVAARDSKRRALGIEKDPDAYNTALAKIGNMENGDAEGTV